MSRRTRRTLLIVAALLVLLALAVFLRSKAPPEAARLLPESDGIIYIDLQPIRTFLHKELKPPERVPEYQQFIDAIGIDPERDLDQVAIALHRMPDPNGPNGPVAYSMVLVGKITGQRLNAWLDAHATSRETYAGHTIYSVPSEGRTVRVAQIGYDMVAVSNFPTPEKIHSILDRHRTAACPSPAPRCCSSTTTTCPCFRSPGASAKSAFPSSESGSIHIFGLALPLEPDSTIIASLRWTGSLHLRVEEIAPIEATATSQAAALATLVTLARGITPSLGANPANNSLKELLETAEVTQHGERVVVTATVPGNFFSGL